MNKIMNGEFHNSDEFRRGIMEKRDIIDQALNKRFQVNNFKYGMGANGGLLPKVARSSNNSPLNSQMLLRNASTRAGK